MEQIKGICEHCGYAYEGSVVLQDGVLPIVKCPKCKEDTFNNDRAEEVNKLNEADGLDSKTVYNHIEKFEYAND